MNQLKNHSIITTEDGSETYFSVRFQEACHSKSGAVAETRLHYIQGCKIQNLAKTTDRMNILEVGFGTGIGFLETLRETSMHQCFLTFHSFELDDELIAIFSKKYGHQFVLQADYAYFTNDQFELYVWRGDARKSIKKIISKNFHFDAIFQDAFSPRKNPRLWTEQWFRDLALLATDSCILSTYSASSSIRKALIASNWKVYPGEKFGTKRASTRATLSGITDRGIQDQLERSPALTLSDDNIEDYLKGILDDQNKNK